MADAHLAERPALGEVGDGVHLVGGGVARHAADRLQRDRDDRVARHAVAADVVADPAVEGRIGEARALQRRRSRRAAPHRRAARNRRRCGGPPPPAGCSTPWRFASNSASISSAMVSMPRLVDEDLDARLVLVVAPSVHVVDAQDRLRIGEQILLRQEVADLLAEHRRAAHAAADIDGEAELARRRSASPRSRCRGTGSPRGRPARRSPRS